MKKYLLYLILAPLFCCAVNKMPPFIQAVYHIQNGNVEKLQSVLDNHSTLLKQNLPTLIHEAIACDKCIVLSKLLDRINTDGSLAQVLWFAILYRSTHVVFSMVSNKDRLKKIRVTEQNKLLDLARDCADHFVNKKFKQKGDLINKLLQGAFEKRAKL